MMLWNGYVWLSQTSLALADKVMQQIQQKKDTAWADIKKVRQQVNNM